MHVYPLHGLDLGYIAAANYTLHLNQISVAKWIGNVRMIESGSTLNEIPGQQHRASDR